MSYTQEQLERQLRSQLTNVNGHSSASVQQLAASGTAQVNGHSVEILVRYAANQEKLPEIRCLTPHKGIKPHVGHECGTICYSSGPVVIDYKQPDAVVGKALTQALGTLRDALTGDSLDGILDEFMHHWGLMAPRSAANSVFCAIEPKSDVHQVESYYSKDGTLRLVTDGSIEVERVLPEDSLFSGRAIYVGLERLTSFPRTEKKWTQKSFRDFIYSNLTRPARRRLQRLSEKLGKVPCVFGVPRNNSTWAMVGQDPTGDDVQDWLSSGDGEIAPRFFVTQRLDRTFLLPRGGANKSLKDCRVMLVGCGAIGCRIAEFLGASGIGYLKLVDPDKLSVENTYRHNLGLSWIGKSKSLVTKVLLERRFPYLRVDVTDSALSPSDEADSQIDIIVCATGDPCVERPLNSRLQRHGLMTAHVYAWVEPLGLGGHTVVVVPGLPGCLECLYSDPQGDGRIYNRTAFVGDPSDQSLFLNLNGCGGGHTPFSDLDAVKTAEQTCRLVLRALSDPTPTVVSWRGQFSEYEARQLPLSPRFRAPEEALRLTGTSFHSTTCPVCASLNAAV